MSLLEDDARAAPHANGLAFALHDLCHLEKFVDPETHAAQVGFFAMLDRAIDGAAWRALVRDFDAAWDADVTHVVADMNGSPVFLLAALKMKLKMASRRAYARSRGEAPRAEGPLDEGEARRYAEALAAMLDAFALPSDVRDAAESVTTQRDQKTAALRLHRHLTNQGEEAILRNALLRNRPPHLPAGAL